MIPVWEEVDSDDVSVLKHVMAKRRQVENDVELRYIRIPITAERPPDFSDLTELIDVAVRNPNTPIVLNCQLGRGRSTMTAVSGLCCHFLSVLSNRCFPRSYSS